MGFASSVQSRSTRDCVRNDVFQKTYTLTLKQSNKSIIACYPSRKVELELRHKMESAVKSLTSKTVYSFYDFGAASKVTV